MKWQATQEEFKLIDRIVENLNGHVITSGTAPLTVECCTHYVMCITACHLNGTPLDLERMAQEHTVDVHHDLVGIEQHTCRKTGVLLNCFVPRLARV